MIIEFLLRLHFFDYIKICCLLITDELVLDRSVRNFLIKLHSLVQLQTSEGINREMLARKCHFIAS